MCPSVIWPQGQQLTTDRWVQQLVALDTNNDGKLDLAGVYVEESSNAYSIVVWLGAGDGTFGAPTVLYVATGWLPNLATADVNGDGYADLVTTEGSSLLVFRGTGSGFAAPLTTSLSATVQQIHVGNFDADSAPELVASAPSAGYFIVFDNVDGSFVEKTTVNTGLFPQSIVSAELNGDTIHDIAVIKQPGTVPSTIEVYAGGASYTYTHTHSLPVGTYAFELRAADFNGDGLSDLVAANWEEGTAIVYRRSGSDYTSTTLETDIPRRDGNARRMLVEDLSGDGIPDLAVAAENGGYLTTFTGVGDGTFRSPSYAFGVDYFDTLQFSSMATGDFDGDGDLDLAGGGLSTLTIASATCATHVQLTPHSPMISAGQTAKLHINVSGFGTTTSQPYGTITLHHGDVVAGTSPVDATGYATISVSGLTNGAAFTAEFSGNSDVPPATSEMVAVSVTNLTTQTTINTPPTPPVYGTDWPVTVAVTGANYEGTTEYILLKVDGVATRYFTGQTINLRLSPGQHTIVAEFEGSYLRPPSTSETLLVTAVKASPTVTLVSGATTVRAGQTHSLAFSVNGPAGMTGTLSLFEGNTLLTSGPVGGTGAANLQTTLARGSHNVRAVYSGDANFNSATLDFTLHVVPDTPLWIDARALASNVQIVYVLPEGASVSQLYRREGAGAWAPVAFDPDSGIDPAVLQRGVVYEYYLAVNLSGGGVQTSNIDGALLFTDDPLVVLATTVKRAHFTELRDAINLMRTAAGLPAFEFDAAFTNDSIIRASHMTGLRTAVSEARSALGMSAATFTHAIAAGAIIRATDIEELRNASR